MDMEMMDEKAELELLSMPEEMKGQSAAVNDTV
jgi:hypothetical protein